MFHRTKAHLITGTSGWWFEGRYEDQMRLERRAWRSSGNNAFDAH